MIRELLLASACVTLAACQPAPPPSEFDFGIPLKEVMRDVMDPAAFGYWDRQGDVVEAGGTRSLVPPDPATLTDEAAKEAAQQEWTKARAGVVQLIQVTNLLKLPGYVRTVEKNDNGDWFKYADRINVLAYEALEAIDAKDGDKMFANGGEIFEVCGQCHTKYLLPFLDPITGELPPGISVSGQPMKKR